MSQGYLVQIIYTLYWNIQVCVYYSRDFAYFLVEGGGGGWRGVDRSGNFVL